MESRVRRPPPLPLEEVNIYRLLSTDRRRLTVQELERAQRPIDLELLADRIANREHELAGTGLPADHQQRVHLALYHQDLPLLAEYGLIEWDRVTGAIETNGALGIVSKYLNIEVQPE